MSFRPEALKHKRIVDLEVTEFDALGKDFWDEFKRIVYKTNGRANCEIAFELYVLGIPSDKIIDVMNSTPQEFASKSPASRYIFEYPRMSKHQRGYKDYCAAGESGFLKPKIIALLGEEFLKTPQQPHHYSYYSGATVSLYEFCVQEGHPKGVAITPMIDFIKLDPKMRDAILANEQTKYLASSKVHFTDTPPELQRLGIDNKQYVRQQSEDYYRELYALALAKDIAPEQLVEPTNRECHIASLSEVAYSNRLIKNAKSLALWQTSNITLERIGLGVYHKILKSRYDVRDRATRRGFVRILQRINIVGKAYDKCLREGQTPETAREVAKAQLEFWLNDGSHTDGQWAVFNHGHWSPEPVKTPPRKKSTRGRSPQAKTHSPSIEELKNMLKNINDNKPELEGNDNE